MGKRDRRGPTSFPVARLGIRIALRPMPKCGCDAAERAGQSLALAPQGPQRVRRRSPFLGETKRTHLRELGGRVAWHGSSEPTGID